MHPSDLDFERIYNDQFPALMDLALSKDIPREEAEQLIHEILLVSLLKLRRIDDIESWLTGALNRAITRRKGAA